MKMKKLCKLIINLKLWKVKIKKVNMTILYKLTSDDGSTATFHNKWDNIESTLTLIRKTKWYSFGEFTNQSWVIFIIALMSWQW